MTEFSTADSSLVLGASNGTIRMVKPATDTDWPGWQHGVYDLVMTDPDGQVLDPLLYSRFLVRPAVTS